jgi:hypothetical protein
MEVVARTLAVAFTLTLSSLYLAPVTADARSSYRRNYAEEWEREDREEQRREERERARQEWMEHQRERQERYLQHDERQLDKTMDRLGYPDPNAPAAPAPAKKGGTCIYGEGNKILYQPEGAVCDH